MAPKHHPHTWSIQRQHGVATLLVSVMILLILAIMTLYTNRSVIIEQRSATNEYKQAQALEAAQAGLAKFMAQLSGSESATNWQAYFSQSGSTITLKSEYENNSRLNNKQYINSAADAYRHNPPNDAKWAIQQTLDKPKNNAGNDTGIAQFYKVYLTSTATPNRFMLVAQGCADSADCGYAAAYVTTEFTVSQNPSCALDINGSTTVYYGSSIHALLNNDPRFNCGISVGSATAVGGTLNQMTGCQTDCYPNPGNRLDPNYSTTGTASKQAHFERYFPGKTMLSLLAERTSQATATLATACVITPVAGTSATAADVQNCYNQGRKQIFVNGNLDSGSTSFGPLGADNIKGVEIVVNGDFSMNSAVSISGFLYVGGNTLSTPSGSLRVDGSAAFGGNVEVNSSLAVYVDSKYSRDPSGGGVKANLALGTWRDF
jgi:Tfp pilus assembly protein PilX